MKAELLNQLQVLIKEENLLAVEKEVKRIAREFRSLVKKEQTELEEKLKDPEFEYEEDFENAKLIREFDNTVEDYFEKKKEQEKAKKEEISKNLSLRQVLLKEFQDLIQNEENIGKAFNQVTEIRNRWKEAGEVAQDKFAELQAEYSRLNDLFNYNINIYKELKEHDLKKNLDLKLEKIEQLEQLFEKEEGGELQKKFRKIQQEWDEIGGTYQEKWEEIKDKYWASVKKIQEKINHYFEALRKTEEENLEKKQILINELKEKIDIIPQTIKEWEEQTKLVLDYQNNWKEIGNVPKSERKEVLKNYREICDNFFERKAEFFKTVKDEFKDNAQLKADLIEKAEALKISTDWQKAGNELINLQKEWAAIGHAGKFAERKLWKKFREANDFFFEAKKNHFSKLNEQQKANVNKVQEIIKELKEIKLSKEAPQAAKMLQDFKDKFYAVSGIPSNEKAKLEKSFYQAYDAKMKEIGLGKEKLDKVMFEARMENIAETPNAEKNIQFEKDKIRKKIDALNNELKQIEANMSFFTLSKGAEKLLAGPKKQIEELKLSIEAEKAKIKQLNITFNALKKEKIKNEELRIKN